MEYAVGDHPHAGDTFMVAEGTSFTVEEILLSGLIHSQKPFKVFVDEIEHLFSLCDTGHTTIKHASRLHYHQTIERAFSSVGSDENLSDKEVLRLVERWQVSDRGHLLKKLGSLQAYASLESSISQQEKKYHRVQAAHMYAMLSLRLETLGINGLVLLLTK